MEKRIAFDFFQLIATPKPGVPQFYRGHGFKPGCMQAFGPMDENDPSVANDLHFCIRLLNTVVSFSVFPRKKVSEPDA